MKGYFNYQAQCVYTCLAQFNYQAQYHEETIRVRIAMEISLSADMHHCICIHRLVDNAVTTYSLVLLQLVKFQAF